MHPTKQDESLEQALMNQAEITPMQAETPPMTQDKMTKAKMPTMTQAETQAEMLMTRQSKILMMRQSNTPMMIRQSKTMEGETHINITATDAELPTMTQAETQAETPTMMQSEMPIPIMKSLAALTMRQSESCRMMMMSCYLKHKQVDNLKHRQ